MQYCSILLISHLFFLAIRRRTNLLFWLLKDTLLIHHVLYMLCVDDALWKLFFFFISFWWNFFFSYNLFVTVFPLRSDTGFILCLYLYRMYVQVLWYYVVVVVCSRVRSDGIKYYEGVCRGTWK